MYGAYILKAGSNLLRETKGRFTTWSLKRVSCCPSDHPREGNMGAQQIVVWHIYHSLTVQALNEELGFTQT